MLRRIRDADAEDVARAVSRSLEHLRPWMRWATAEAGQFDSQRERIASAHALWDEGDCRYVIRALGDVLVGGCGLHRRVGPGGIEIGYWIAVGHTRRGYATAAARALTEAALALPDIVRVEIHCNYANVPSQAVPRRLGYRLERIEPCEIVAPAEVGKRMIWVWTDRSPGHAAHS